MQVIGGIGGYLPTDEQLPFLKACYLDPPQALAAWEQWRAHHTLDTLDVALFQLLPLLYGNLRRAGYGGAEMPTLKGIYRRNWYFRQKMSHAVEQVLKQFRTHKIPTLLLKGVALSHVYYPDPHMRYMADADMMIPLHCANDGMALLLESGWRLKAPLKRATSHAGIFIRDDGTELDLHWRLFNRYCDEAGDDIYWQRAVPLRFQSEETLTLSAADHLFHACIHGYEWNVLHSLRWIVDARMILKRAGDTIDWPYMAAQAARQKLSLCLGNALGFLHTACGMPVPVAVLDELRAIPVSRFERREHMLLVQPKDHALKMAFLRPWERIWYRQCRFYPRRSLAFRILTFPAMLRDEMYLGSVWQLPWALTLLMCRKLCYRFFRIFPQAAKPPANV